MTKHLTILRKPLAVTLALAIVLTMAPFVATAVVRAGVSGPSQYIEVNKTMLEMAGEEPADNKFRLFDEFASMVGYPPSGTGNPAKPYVNSAASANDNVWRTPGASYYDAGNNIVRVKFGETSLYNIETVWVYDGPVYAPSTYTVDGSAPYEVMGGKIEVYSYDGTVKLGEVVSANRSAWVPIDVTALYPGGYQTNGLRFVKTSDSVVGTPSSYSWTNEMYGPYSMQYYCDADIAEVLLYGSKVEGSGDDYLASSWNIESVKVPPGTPVTGGVGLNFDQFVGSNSFFTEAQAAYEIVGNIREYHTWGWTEYTANDRDIGGVKDNSITSMNPHATFIDGWGFDNYYKAMHDRGVDVTICMQGGAYGYGARPSYQDPDGMSSTKASSYLGHGQSMFQLAARYGSNTAVDPSLVRVAPGTNKAIGLGYVKYYEDYNEPNLGAFSGAQFAAMLSADYDGHMGTLGPGVGIKQADPNAQLVLGGLAGIITQTKYNGSDWNNNDFVAAMMHWFDTNRTLDQWKAAHGGSADGYVKYPFDVFNGHYYCPDGSTVKTGQSPEQDHIFQRMSEFVQFRNDYFPDKQIWLSEFGWDTSQGTPTSATAQYVDGKGVTQNVGVNVGLTGYEVQARWLVREYLMLAAAGINRVQQFMMPNSTSNPSATGRFDTCGFINGTQGSTDFKPSWYYVGTMGNVLKDASLDDVQIVEDGGWKASGGGPADVETDGPMVLKFNSTKNTDQIYALWLPTSLGDMNGANKENYSLALPDGYDHATLVTLQDKTKWGVRSDITGQIANNAVSVSISEQPVFVILSQGEYYNPVSGIIDAHNFKFDTLTPASGNPSKLFDEFRTDTGTTPAPNDANAWDPGYRDKYAIIDLGAKYNLDTVYAWDTNNTLLGGNVFAVYAYTGAGAPSYTSAGMTAAQVRTMLAGSDWERICWFDFGNWMTWDAANVSATTRYLVVGIEDGPSTIAKDQWNGPYLPVTEMMLKGSLAKGETPPEPWVRTFEPKPSSDENQFLFDNDFDGVHNDSYNFWGGTATAVDGTNANGTAGKILKVDATVANPQFTIPASYLASMQRDKWYYVDLKLKLTDTTYAPELRLLNTWSPVYNANGTGNRFKPIWSPDSGAVTVVPGEWHQIKAKFKIDAGNNIAYEIFYDGASIGAAATTIQQTLPLGGLLLQMTANPFTAGSTYYYDDVWVYTPLPKSTLLNGTFDDLTVNSQFKNNDDGLAVDSNYPATNTVVQPASSSGAYLGAGDQLLRVTNVDYVFRTNSAAVLDETKVGEDYVFELSFYATAAQTSPTFQFLYGGWMRDGFADTNWHGGMMVYNQAKDWNTSSNIYPTANQWHRFVVKYRFNTVSQITFSVYYDGALLQTVTRDSAVPGGMQYQIDNLISSMGFLVGVSHEGPGVADNPLYINDVLIYRGDVKPWPEKYTNQTPVTTYQVTVNSAGTGASGSGQYAKDETVYINAGTAPAGMMFSGWTTTDAGVTFANSGSAATSFAMPDHAVTVTANFVPDTTPKYSVTVVSAGTGASGSGQYAGGATVMIGAGTVAGKHFVNWTSADGVSFANANSPSTTFAMPAKNVTVTANFADDIPLSDKIPWAGFSFYNMTNTWMPDNYANMFQYNAEFDPKMGVTTLPAAGGYPANWAVPYFDQSNTNRYTLIDLGKVYDINEIDLMIKGWGAAYGAFKVYYGDASGLNLAGGYAFDDLNGIVQSSWTEAVPGLAGSGGNEWYPSFKFGAPITTRYLMFTTLGPGTNIAVQQMLLYGKEYVDPTILRGTFDSLTAGAQLREGDELLGCRYPNNGYVPSVVVAPSPSDPFYLGGGDQLLSASRGGWMLNTISSGIVSKIELNKDYVFDFYFYPDSAGAGAALRLLYNTWNNWGFTGFWGGQLQVYNGTSNWARIDVAPKTWHRIAIKYSFPSETVLSYDFYFDGALVTSASIDFAPGADSPVDAGNRVTNLRSTMGFEIRCDSNGLADDSYKTYVNDVYIYQASEIRPWDAKYNAAPAKELDKSALQAAILAAGALVPGDYSAASWNDLSVALAAARAADADINDYSEANQQAVDAAANALSAAMANLSTDKTALASALAGAQAILANPAGYTAASLAVLQAAADAAQTVYDDPAAKQSAIDEQAALLAAAVKTAVPSSLLCSVKSMAAKIGKPLVIPYTWDGPGAVTITSSNPAVCGVNGDALIPLKAGISVITISAPNGTKVVFAVTVTA
ncbi:MAG: hypothetical protein FWC55_06945 [Firmicutes bacterium]|nr:hypothetical protein [Bacillota bacterium]